MNWSSIAALAIGVVAASSSAGCAPRPRMCTATSECATGSSTSSACVAGRCQPDRPNVKPAIDAARRLVVHPVDIAYLRRGDGPSGGALPPLFALGKDSAVLMMRFSVALAANANVVEAYVVLRRTDAVDDDPAPISLHATRIVDAWEGRSISWALQPRVVDKRLPVTVVEPGGPALVRLDVRELVRQWPKHDPRDQGIAIVAVNESRSGSTFAFRAVGDGRGSSSDSLTEPRGLPPARGEGPRSSSSTPRAELEPYLELYVR